MSLTNMTLLPKKENFQKKINGKLVDLFYLKNNKIQVALTNYGCRIVSFIVKDKNNNDVDIVCGFDSIEAYTKATEYYHGAIIGRYANRIANGSFELNGKKYSLAKNNNANHLHGGIKGFHDVVWDIKDTAENKISFQYNSLNGEEGYPGNLNVTVTYTLQSDQLLIDFYAVSDADTILNLTNHSYFNLNGEGRGNILDHQLYINADHYTPVNENLIPLGSLEAIEKTPFDFRNSKKIGKDIDADFQQLIWGKGYDHNFVLNNDSNELKIAAKATGDKTSITLEVLTTEPGIQLYTGNFMQGENTFKNGADDNFRTAFCLETQHFPDSPNHPNFPTTVLKKGEEFKSSTVFKIS